jgi:tetratricopeptide (TPR) repeat protein
MRCLILTLGFVAAPLWSAPSMAQSRAQLGPLCTSEGTPVDQQIDARSKIIALGNAWRSKGDFAHAIADYDEAIRLNPKEAYSYQNRGAAKQALGELDGALADINQAIRLIPRCPRR